MLSSTGLISFQFWHDLALLLANSRTYGGIGVVYELPRPNGPPWVTGDAPRIPRFHPNCSPTERDPTPFLTYSRISYVPTQVGFSVSPRFEIANVVLTGCTRTLCAVRHLRLGSSMPRGTAIQPPHFCFLDPPTLYSTIRV